nr:MAG TPA: hypothetical protein [Caudoviricetes sp.]
MKPKPQSLRLGAVDDRPCHDKAAREIVRQARERALAYPTEAHDSKNRAARGLTYYPSTRKPDKETL